MRNEVKAGMLKLTPFEEWFVDQVCNLFIEQYKTDGASVLMGVDEV